MALNKFHLNNFMEGLDKDSSNLFIKNTKYRHAENIRLNTEIGATGGSLENIRGNLASFTIPDTYEVYEIIPILPVAPASLIYSLSITTNSITYTVGGLLTTIENLYNDIVAVVNPAYVKVAYNSTSIIITGLVSTLNAPVLSGVSGSVNLILGAKTGLRIVGSTPLKDDIYIYTSDETATNPTTSGGQIWKLTYNNTTNFCNISLVYNNMCNFSTGNYIPDDDGSIGVNEDSETQKIFWTDNFNYLRYLNVADPQCFATTLESLSIFPLFTPNVPVLTSINQNGSLTAGVKQYAYRLRNGVSGSSTNFSPVSLMVNIIAEPEASSYQDYYPGGATTNKSVTYYISEIDNSYSHIEIAVIERTDSFSVPTISIIKQEPITADIYRFTHYGTEAAISITLEEFLISSIVFDTVKSISSKDNYLFATNVVINNPDIDWDARAYRFPISSLNTQIKSADNTITLITSTTLSSVPETHDCINPNQDPDNTSGGLYNYEAGTTILGGTGTNISYRFKTKELIADDIYNSIPSTSNYQPPYTTNNRVTTVNTMNGNTVFNNDFAPTMKSPYLSQLYRTGWCEETYRYGIVLYKNGIKTPVKWIADIRFPRFNDTNFYPGTAASQNSISDFRLHFIGSDGKLYLQVPYLEFTVNTSNHPEITAYEIVRVKREESDKSVLSYFVTSPVNEVGVDFFANNNTVGVSTHKIIINSPEFLFNKYQAVNGDILKFRGTITTTNLSNSTALTLNFNAYKPTSNPSFTSLTSIIPDNLYAIPSSYSNEVVVSLGAGINFRNRNSTSTPLYLGSKCLLATKSSSAFPMVSLANSKYFGLISRTNSGQYGGNTYNARTNNIYISTNSYRIAHSAIQTTSVFGGDAFINLFEMQEKFKNWGSIVGDPGSNKESHTFFYPIISSVNTDLREGAYVSNTAFPNNGTSIDLAEDFTYNNIWSSEDELKVFLPVNSSFKEIEEYPARTYSSQVKIIGELGESWGLFKDADYINMENQYGSVNKTLVFRNKLMYWQDKAFGVIEINPRALIPDASGTYLITGTGSLLNNFTYLSNKSGLKNQRVICPSDNAIYWVDDLSRKFNRFSGEEGLASFSILKGMDSWFKTALFKFYDKHMTYDYDNDEVLITYLSNSHGDDYTLVYSERVGGFTGFQSATPPVYVNSKYALFSPSSTSSVVYIHNKGDYGNFYGTVYPSSVQFITNPSPINTKQYLAQLWYSTAYNSSNIELRDETFTSKLYNTDYQSSGDVTISNPTNTKRVFRDWRTSVDKNIILDTSYDVAINNSANQNTAKPYKDNMMDKFLSTTLTYDNTNNNKLCLHYVATEYQLLENDYMISSIDQ